jgi:hypothetical protein
MDTTTHNTVTVSIAAADLQAWIAAHAADLKPEHASLRRPGPGAPRGSTAPLELVWPISRNYLDAFLRGVIPNLPQAYSVQPVVGDADVVARVVWRA